ncbi:tetrahydromethanopterin synthesis protein [Rubrivivax gelatinosus]|nr:tetrahydromethanopterin synthesis protein [Rubrivivax gelatinosus]
MNEAIFETVVTTVDARGAAHVAPMGVRYREGRVVLMPFRPSATLDNILATRHAVLNLVTDVRVFAGCVTGRRDWPLERAERIRGLRLAAALRHVELRLEQVDDDAERPLLTLLPVHEATHAPFVGLNRAQAAVVEAAVLVSRLFMLAPEKVEAEMRYLQIAIDKTAGAAELEAWGWLLDAVATWRSRTEAA